MTATPDPTGSAADVGRLPFDQATCLTPEAPGVFRAELRPEWTIVGKPHGGYLLAILGRAAAQLSRHPHPVAVSAHYLHSPDPGPVAVEAELLRSGRSASQLRARMSQGGRPCVEALVTTSRLSDEAQYQWTHGLSPAPDVAYEDCSRLVPEGFPVALMEQIELRLEPASLGFTRGTPRGAGELRGWLSLPHDRPFDPLALLFAVDAFPPATFDIQMTGWVPTLELTCYVRALPSPGPVRIVQRVQLISDQRVDQTCSVWDSSGRFVAQATQLGAIRLG